MVNYILVGFVYKVGFEAVLLPLTYRVIALVKRYEPEYALRAGGITGRRNEG